MEVKLSQVEPPEGGNDLQCPQQTWQDHVCLKHLHLVVTSDSFYEVVWLQLGIISLFLYIGGCVSSIRTGLVFRL